MPVTRSLRRLLRIRDIEEEQHRLTLELAQSELRTIEDAIVASQWREQEGRMLVDAGLASGDVTDVQSGRLEVNSARSNFTSLLPRRDECEQRVNVSREALREKQIERRQTEAVIEAAMATEKVKSVRHSQNDLDDWFRARTFHEVICDSGQGHAVNRTASTTEPSAIPAVPNENDRG